MVKPFAPILFYSNSPSDGEQRRLRYDGAYDVAVDVGQAKVASAMPISKVLMVESQ